jgi:hypothetical protein
MTAGDVLCCMRTCQLGSGEHRVGAPEPHRQFQVGRDGADAGLQIGQPVTIGLRQVFGLLQPEAAVGSGTAQVGEFRVASHASPIEITRYYPLYHAIFAR